MAGDDNGVESLCWECLRAGWQCLCQYPSIVPKGAEIQEIVDEEGEVARVVAACPIYWPDTRERAAAIRYSDSAEDQEHTGESLPTEVEMIRKDYWSLSPFINMMGISKQEIIELLDEEAVRVAGGGLYASRQSIRKLFDLLAERFKD